jgi:putative nucleotidyltransferase with HDIG domain
MMRRAAAEQHEPAAIRVRLLRLFASETYEPPRLPHVALEIMQLSRKPAVQFEEVVALLERDPILAAKVLSICRSAAYAGRAPILSLKQAVVRLGMKGLRDLVVEAALQLRVFRVPGYDGPMERLSRHSTAVARLVPALCGRAGIDAEYAFLCGLLHDVGIAACLLALSDDPRAGPVPFPLVEPVIHELHEEASGLLARLWDLPGEIREVVAAHHRLVHGGTPHPVTAALIVADRLATDARMGAVAATASACDLTPEEEFAAARAFLRVDDAMLALLKVEAAEIAARI